MYSSSNPGLAAFDLTNYKGVQGLNFYDEDRLLQEIVAEYTNASRYDKKHTKDLISHLREYGALAGDILDRLVTASHKEGKWGQLVKYDRTGKRIDRIEYCFEQREVRRINYEHGIVNLDFHPNWPHEFTDLHRMALAYLANTNGEGGFTCPLAMTDGMIRVLKALGSPKQKEKYLKLIADPKSKSHFMAGQYVTERVGGSNVAENRTIARKSPNTEHKWILEGEKWFCSNPGDLWVTTARIEGTNRIGMFLVPRIKDNEELNGCHILRKKEIMGTKGKLTVEVVYDNLEAEELGRPPHGLANLIEYVIKTSRLHVAISAIGLSRRAFMEARAYSKARTAYGKNIGAFSSVQKTLAEMQVLHSSMLWCIFRNIDLSAKKESLSTMLTPLLKYSSTTHSTWLTYQAIMLHGGNGILEDFSCLPRLHNDSIINETWEGTHQIITEHALKAFLRPKVQKAYFALIEENCAGSEKRSELSYALEILQKEQQIVKNITQAEKQWIQRVRLKLCDSLYNCLALSEWLRKARLAPNEIWDALALGLAEIIDQGKGGIARPEGVFCNSKWMDTLIEY